MESILDLGLTLAALPALAASGYLLFLAMRSRRPQAPLASTPRLRFAVVVPAHDEEAGISATVESLRSLDYPEARRRIWVVADNCRDATAARARAAGAEVLERNDSARRGKGYALALAFAHLLDEGWADAVVVVDADTVVSPNLLRAFEARLEAGAGAIQCSYGVRNPEASWRTRLMAIAFALFNTMRSIARERNRCSVGLKGNGMCFSVGLLRAVPHAAYSIVEDVEYGIHLALDGRRVHFAGEAEVLGEMVADASASGSQRRRWEEGRRELRRQYLLPLLRHALARRDRVTLDLALELLVPPLAALAVGVAIGLALSLALVGVRGGSAASPWAWGASAAALVACVTRGWWISGTGVRGLGALLRAPLYVVWKMGLALGRAGRPGGVWVRTRRATETSHSNEPPAGNG